MAITPVFCCGFECGVSTGATAHWALTGTGASFQTTTFRNGLRAGRCHPAGTSSSFQRTLAVAPSIAVFRFGLFFTTLPSVDCELGTVNPGGFDAGVYFSQSDSKLYAGLFVGAYGATGVSVTTGVWYYIDVRVDSSTTTWTMDVKVNGTACAQTTNSSSISTFPTFTLGNWTTIATGDWFYDDVIFSATVGDYPIGDGKVLPSSPVADGTHTGTTTNFVKGAAGTSLTVTSTDVWQLVDDIPLAVNTSDWVNQQTSAATQYVEVIFATATATDGPRGVEVITAAHKLTTAAADMKHKLNDNGTTALVWQTGLSSAAGSSALAFQTKQFSSMVGGGAWTKLRSDALRFRFGYSTDAIPDVFWDAVLIEAEFIAPPAGVTLTSFNMAGSGAMPAVAVTLAHPITAAI